MIYHEVQQITAMSWAEIADLTFPQMRTILNRGRDPEPRIEGASEIRAFLKRFREGRLGQTG